MNTEKIRLQFVSVLTVEIRFHLASLGYRGKMISRSDSSVTSEKNGFILAIFEYLGNMASFCICASNENMVSFGFFFFLDMEETWFDLAAVNKLRHSFTSLHCRGKMV